MTRFYQKGEFEEIYQRFNEGGILYFIERKDTNQFYSERMLMMNTSHANHPDEEVEWLDSLGGIFGLSGAFLTKEDAEKHNHFTQGGCRHCEHGSTKIPTIVTEHEFVASGN